MNYFELFGFEEKPFADAAAAARKYVELQKKFHPDFFTNSSEDEQEAALQQSAGINKAYNIFRDPEKTIEYFLQQKGIITADEKYNLPPDFLMEMMELNESLEEKDPASAQQDVSAAGADLYSEVESIISAASGTISDADMQKLKAYYYKKKYLKRILDRLGD